MPVIPTYSRSSPHGAQLVKAHYRGAQRRGYKTALDPNTRKKRAKAELADAAEALHTEVSAELAENWITTKL